MRWFVNSIWVASIPRRAAAVGGASFIDYLAVGFEGEGTGSLRSRLGMPGEQ
jgi:hypothetical protein